MNVTQYPLPVSKFPLSSVRMHIVPDMKFYYLIVVMTEKGHLIHPITDVFVYGNHAITTIAKGENTVG